MIKVPCRGCEERTAECHATCEKYKRYKRELEELKNKKKAGQSSDDLIAYGRDKVDRLDRLR